MEPNRAFSSVEAETREEHFGLFSWLPLPIENGARSLPENARESVGFITERGAGAIGAFWKGETEGGGPFPEFSKI